jgi:hypothetical protein
LEPVYEVCGKRHLNARKINSMKTLGQDIVEILREHAKIQRLDQRAKNGIQKWLEQEDNLPQGCKPDQIHAEFSSRSLCFEPKVLPYAFIETRYELYAGKIQIGHYRLITTLDGCDDDDYFVLDDYFTDS